MARIHYWQYLADEDGKPISGVAIKFYLQDSVPETEAQIYLNPTVGHTTTTTAVSLTTDVDGYFQFWLGDEWELNGGYASTQKFKLTWSGAGLASGNIENLDIYPPLYQVNTTITGVADPIEARRKNKLISNELAQSWTSHVDLTLPVTAGTPPHNIYPVELCQTDSDFNKVFSNLLASEIYTTALSASTATLDASAADIYPSGSGTTFLSAGIATNIQHNLNNEWPIVQLVDDADSLVVIPEKIESIDADNIEITTNTSITAHVTIIG